MSGVDQHPPESKVRNTINEGIRVDILQLISAQIHFVLTCCHTLMNARNVVLKEALLHTEKFPKDKLQDDFNGEECMNEDL